MNSATACHTGAHPAAVACGSTLPGANVSVPPSTSSDARGLAIVTRSASSTAITPVATFASTRAVRCRASSSAAWLRRTSVAIRSNALSTGSNSRGVPCGKAGGSLPRPTAMAASRNAARQTRQVYRGNQPDDRRQQDAEGEILPLLPNALVVQQLRHCQHSLLTGWTRRNDEKTDAGRPAAGARVDGRLELILERAPEDLGSEKWIDQTKLPQHRRARSHEYAPAIQPQFGVEPAAQLDQGASDCLGRILGDGFGAGGGVRSVWRMSRSPERRASSARSVKLQAANPRTGKTKNVMSTDVSWAR